MPAKVRLAYLLVLAALFAAAFFIQAPWWASALIGVAAMVPIAVADVVISRRAQAAHPADA